MADPSLTIAITAWMRHAERLTYFKRTVAALKQHLKAPVQGEEQGSSAACHWLVAAEVSGCNTEAQSEFAEFCKEQRLRVVEHPGAPDLGDNLNFMISKIETEFMLYVQDDWELYTELHVGPDIRVLCDGVDMVQYYWWPDSPEALGCSFECDGVRYHNLVPEFQNWYYRDNPYLARRDAFGRIGPFDRCDEHPWRAEYGYANRTKGKLRIVGRGDQPYLAEEFFRHIGSASSMT